jgi:hypothetical protein
MNKMLVLSIVVMGPRFLCFLGSNVEIAIKACIEGWDPYNTAAF